MAYPILANFLLQIKNLMFMRDNYRPSKDQLKYLDSIRCYVDLYIKSNNLTEMKLYENGPNSVYFSRSVKTEREVNGYPIYTSTGVFIDYDQPETLFSDLPVLTYYYAGPATMNIIIHRMEDVQNFLNWYKTHG